MVETRERKLHIVSFTPDQLSEIEAKFGMKPLVAEVVLGRTLRSTLKLLEEAGVRITYNPSLVLCEEETEAPDVKTGLIYFNRSLGSVRYFDREEEEKLYSMRNWDSMYEWERSNAQSEFDKLPKYDGIGLDSPYASEYVQIVQNHLQNGSEYSLPAHPILTKDLCFMDRDLELGRPRRTAIPRHIVMEYSDRYGMYVSCHPYSERDVADIFMVGFSEKVYSKRHKLKNFSFKGIN